MIRDRLPLPSAALTAILELGSWAPSGDNTQPWRFEVRGDRHVVLHGQDTRAHCVYDLDGHPSQLAIGCLIETLAIAASAEGWRLDPQRRLDGPDDRPTYDLHFSPDASISADGLLPSIRTRSVQRRPMAMRRLTAAEKAQLEASVGADHQVQWLDGPGARRRAAALMFRSAKVRLTMPEAYRVHREVIEWNARYSADRVPDQALGVGAGTLALMRFVMKSWPRVTFFNRFLAGTWVPRLQMDWWPGLACAAHVVISARTPPGSTDDHVAAGRAVQRFWLTATRLGLGLQPELTPLIFARYAREGRQFSNTAGIAGRARAIAAGLERLLGAQTASRAVFMGRIGDGPAASARSHRRPLSELMSTGPAGRSQD